VLMSLTGFRLQDARISKGDIQNGFIVKRQSKTSGLVRIPFTNRMKSICEKYNFEMKTGNVGYWNTAFRNMLKDTNIPSLFEEITTVNYIGHKPIELTQAKYLHCTAHSLRRTMINQCLLRGMRYDQITLLTGHKSFEVFQTYIDRNTDTERLDAAFNFLDDVVFEQPIMKVA
jgi:integrase